MISIGSDHGGFRLKQEVKKWLQEWGYQVEDFGVNNEDSVDYPDYAIPVANAVAQGTHQFGILVCGTGIGMALAANKIKGVRAASVTNIYSARMFREHNNGNVLCLGARVLGVDISREITKTFLNTEFAGGRHLRRVEKIIAAEKK